MRLSPRRVADGVRCALIGLIGAVATAVVLLAATSPAQAHRFVYVANQVSTSQVGRVSQFAIRAGGLLSPLSPPTVPSRVHPIGVAISPDGESAYVTNIEANRVSQYDISQSTGRLSLKVRAVVRSGRGPQGIAVSPNGKNAYVANSNNIFQYSINPLNGQLVPKTSPRVVVPTADPHDVAVTPDGKSAYVTTFNFVVLQYDIDPSTGRLSPKNPPTVTTGSGADSTNNVAVAPNGRSAYVTSPNPGNQAGAGTVSQYDIDPLTGELSLKTPATVPAGINPVGIAVTRDGKNAYAVNLSHPLAADTVSQYTINSVSGRLSPKTPARVPAGSGATEVALSPDSKNAYVTNQLSNDISQYSINPVSGALSPKAPATVAAGQGPFGIAVAATHPPPAP